MNSFEVNKIIGAVLGTIFVLFGGSLLAGALFSSEEPAQPGYEIKVAEATSEGGGQEKQAQQEPPIAALLQTADVDAGAKDFKKCQACHSGEKGGPNKIGPHLWGVVDRPVASIPDFAYSSAMKDFSDGGSKHWTYEHLYHFLKNPKGYVPGTAMGFTGFKDPKDRANVIAYLRTLNDNPPPLSGRAGRGRPERLGRIQSGGRGCGESRHDHPAERRDRGLLDPGPSGFRHAVCAARSR